MTLLVISPDYASHLLPLATLATAWRDAGQRVVVASGPATAAIVEQFGFERVDLRLGRGSNPGVIRAEDQPTGEDDALRGFFDATRRGMVETLTFQAEARLTDLMWEPVRIGREVLAVVASVAPDQILVDHLAFSARVALDSAGIAYGDVVLGHPSALPLSASSATEALPASGARPAEVYGYPPAWPAAFTPESHDLADLRDLCERVSARFTDEWNAALTTLNPTATPVPVAFEEHGPTLLYNYPAELAPERTGAFLGSAVRTEPLDDEVEVWLAGSDEPFVYVSFGSFLSVRGDVLARVARALESLGLRAALALGSADRAEVGELPAGWLVREFLPQVRLLGRATAAVTHGGNNSVTEAVTAGVPMLVLPFSTDQFAGAAALEAHGFGVALDPNAASADDLVDGLRAVLALDRAPITALAQSVAQTPGSARALAALVTS